MTRTLVTGSPVAAGSAVAVNPCRTQPWLPFETVRATGRPVRRRRSTASRSAPRNWGWRRAGSGHRRSGAARRSSRRVDTRPRPAGRSGCACASRRSSAAARRSSGRLALDDVAHDLDAGGGAPQPALLGREDPRAIEVDAAVPGRERGLDRRRGRRPADRDAERDEQRERRVVRVDAGRHATILPQVDGSRHRPADRPDRSASLRCRSPGPRAARSAAGSRRSRSAPRRATGRRRRARASASDRGRPPIDGRKPAIPNDSA